MLTEERHHLILQLLKEKEVRKLQEFVEATGSSESTIRRDLSQLEDEKKLIRVHGGAALIKQKRSEPSMMEKSNQHAEEKKRIAMYAAEFLRKGDCIYLDAGTTTLAMIPHIEEKDITVVTNSITHAAALTEKGIQTFVTGGFLKANTRALIGQGALHGLNQYSFDKCFIGVNGIQLNVGFTTPDPEEALIKRTAMKQSLETYVLADRSKFNETAFAHIAHLNQAVIITDKLEEELLHSYKEKTSIKEVEA
ncbi:DeoR faimly transcriptional regulator [Bacillus sp. FJAT-27231]|uniref:DeoR/GlpR family DNA-binding transcription regulator n=1 Tax=Bacillus sp. FJAT-27231 TaxID=1679168 RepID=UPI000670F3A5|nr:DeoR/GlpR family DNA-binding transcription regulator [Bacillus sp. FJAT-27231]KMY53091.1 DeoR faimly transcriptional regulator [Bacillus sp. FJAT-27231]